MSASEQLIVAVKTSMLSAFASIGTIMFAVSDALGIAIVTGVVSVLTSSVAALFAYRAKSASQEAKAVTEKTAEAVNGKMEKMLEIAKSLAREEGVKAGVEAAEHKAAIQAVSKAEGRAEAIQPTPPPDKPTLSP